MPKNASFSFRVRFNDCDYYQHMNNNAYLNYCDHAVYEFFSKLDPGVKDSEYIYNLVRNEADYLRPAEFDDELTIETSIERLGNTSITFAQRVVRPADGAVLLQVKKIGVFLSRRSGTKTAVPEFIRQAAG